MSSPAIVAQPVPAFPPPPPPILVFQPERGRDATTLAVLKHLQQKDRITADYAKTFDHLVAICYKAVQPYFLADRYGRPVSVQEIPQFDDVTGKRTAGSSRTEGKKYDETRRWIQEWLLTFLGRYRTLSHEELVAAADRGEFRHIGNDCQSDLVDKLRPQLEQRRPDFVSLDSPIGNDLPDAQVGRPPSLHNYLVTRRVDAPSSWATAKVSLEERLTCGERVCQAVLANADEFARLDVLYELLAFAYNIRHYPSRSFDGRVAQAIAALRKVSLQTARRYKQKLLDTMKRELDGGNPAVRAVFLELDEPVSPQPVLALRSPKSEANGQLWRESAKLHAEFEQDCRRERLSERAWKPPAEITEQQQRDLWV